MTGFEIATTLEELTDLAELTTAIEPPKSSYLPYARVVNKGNGGTRGIGMPVASWTFGVLSIEQYNQLKSFCPEASAEIYIRTKKDDDSFAEFQGKIIWPNDPQDRWYAQRRSFTILFRNLIEVESS